MTYLKLLIQKTEADTRATESYIKRNLTKLDTYMLKEVSDNITKVNEYVNPGNEISRKTYKPQ
jgi:hypothetical protein